MASTISSLSATLSVGWSIYNTTSYSANTTNASSFSHSTAFTQGSGAAKASKLYIDQQNITGSGGTASYDLSGSLEDPVGNAVVFTTVKGLYVEHNSGTATGGNLVVSGNFLSAGTNPPMGGTTPTVNIRPGGSFYLNCGVTDTLNAGYTVTNTTADAITLTNNATGGGVNGAGQSTVKVIIWGE